MKKIICFLFTLMLVVSMAVPAFAITPDLGIPDVPEIPDISDDIEIELPDSVLDDWFHNHPIIWKHVIKIKLPENFLNNFKFNFGG